MIILYIFFTLIVVNFVPKRIMTEFSVFSHPLSFSFVSEDEIRFRTGECLL